MKNVKLLQIIFGCDPEFFFSKDGKIVGADKVIPETGIVYTAGELIDGGSPNGQSLGNTSKVVIDGVQAELNPRASTCRVLLGREIAACFKKLKETIKNNYSVDFKQTVMLSPEEMADLSPRCKKFGCMPSKNAHTHEESVISVDASVYNGRSAGGHIHLGSHQPEVMNTIRQYERVIRMMDLLVGNTCVLLDRDPGNVERRKVYGRAGEYRTPDHGVEYRTLSNFWLKDYRLMSLVMGLSRMAVSIVHANRDMELLELVDMREVEQAINRNDFDLAMYNFDKIADVAFGMICGGEMDEFVDIYPGDLVLFRHFIDRGIDYWFKEDPLEHWVNHTNPDCTGFGYFLETTVASDYKKSK